MGQRCAYASRCSLWEEGRLLGLEGVSRLFEARYCGGNYDRCVRFQIAEARGFDRVPSDMYPNDVARARSLMSAVPGQ